MEEVANGQLAHLIVNPTCGHSYPHRNCEWVAESCRELWKGKGGGEGMK